MAEQSNTSDAPRQWQPQPSAEVRTAGYPATIRVLVILLLIALPIGALFDLAGQVATPLPWRIITMVALDAAALTLFACLPITRLRPWAQLLALAVQCGLLVGIQIVFPSDVLGYIFLAPVIQAVYLFGPWMWIPVAVTVWLAWGGAAIAARRDWLDWVGNNIYAVYLVVAVALGAAVYKQQHRLKNQAEGLIQSLRVRYLAALATLEATRHTATLEERGRLTSTVSNELRAALTRLEQTISGIIGQDHVGAAMAHPLLAQAQGYARETVESLRAALVALRPADEEQPRALPETYGSVALANEPFMSAPLRHVLDWLPLAFICGAPLLVLFNGRAGSELLMSLAGCLVLAAVYGYTHWRRSTPWFSLGLVVQSCVLLLLVLLTQTPTLLLGLVVVGGQLALRSSVAQIATGLAALQGAVAIVAGLLTPTPWQVIGSLLSFGIVSAALIVPLLSARRRFSQHSTAVTMLRDLGSALDALEQRAAAARREAATAERHRVAREIHDGLGHALMAVSIQLRVAQETLDDDPATALRQLHETRALIQEARRQLSCSLDALSPLPHTPDALTAALEALAGAQGHATCCKLTLDGSPDDLPPDVALALLRAAEEGVTNALRHGGATHISITFNRLPHAARIVVEDNGTGSSNPATLGSGLGLRGLSERANLLGGICEAGSRPNGGFALFFEVPLL